MDSLTEKYDIGSQIGLGNFGLVFSGRSRSDSSLVALKMIPITKVDVNVRREIKNMLHCGVHPFVVSLREVILAQEVSSLTGRHLCLVQDLAAGGELFTLVASRGKLDESLARSFFQQIIFGVEHLHFCSISHRDLKLENVLLSTSISDLPSIHPPRIQICDLGYSKGNDDSVPHSTVGTPAYIAPEILSRGKQYDGQKADVWSCGVMLYVMLCGVYPFEDPAQPRNWRRTMQKIVQFEFDLPDRLTTEAADLLRRMLSSSDARISLQEIKQHPFFQPGINSILLLAAGQKEGSRSIQTLEEIEALIDSIASLDS